MEAQYGERLQTSVHIPIQLVFKLHFLFFTCGMLFGMSVYSALSRSLEKVYLQYVHT